MPGDPKNPESQCLRIQYSEEGKIGKSTVHQMAQKGMF
jgi:hypothetical protein